MSSAVGRPSGYIEYIEVVYRNKEYIVGRLSYKGDLVQFVFDKEDADKVVEHSWHKSSNNYISSACKYKNKRKELYLHNLVMNRLEFPGKGARESVDHINRNGLDNRKENLRLITQSEQNMNQTKRQRSITLPDGCGIDPSEIPRHIWYIKAQGAHGDRFAIEFKTEKICWKSSSSKKLSLKEKLQEAKDKLQEFYVQYPHLNPFDTNKLDQEKALQESFEEIICLVK
jgi:hypothetical protein